MQRVLLLAGSDRVPLRTSRGRECAVPARVARLERVLADARLRRRALRPARPADRTNPHTVRLGLRWPKPQEIPVKPTNTHEFTKPTLTETYNAFAKPFVWVATADSISEKTERLCHKINET